MIQETFDDVADRLDWDMDKMLMVISNFVTEAGLDDELDTFAREWAAFEDED